MNDKDLHELLKDCGAEIRRTAQDPVRFEASRSQKNDFIRRAVALGLNSENAPSAKRFFPKSISFGIGIGALGAACLLIFSLSSQQDLSNDEQRVALNEQAAAPEVMSDFGIADAYSQLQTAVETDEGDTSGAAEGEQDFAADAPLAVEEGDGNIPEYVSLTVESPNLFYEEESDNETETFDS